MSAPTANKRSYEVACSLSRVSFLSHAEAWFVRVSSYPRPLFKLHDLSQRRFRCTWRSFGLRRGDFPPPETDDEDESPQNALIVSKTLSRVNQLVLKTATANARIL